MSPSTSERHDMPFLNTLGLADRWLCSTRKIEQRRQSGEGPAYVKIGSQVLYDMDVVRAYEVENTFCSTAEQDESSVMAEGPSHEHIKIGDRK
jgi:hypothetical protein